MSLRDEENTKNTKVLLIGFTFILFVGIYFLGRRFFFEQNVSHRNDVLEVALPNETQENTSYIEPSVLMQKMQSDTTIKIFDVRTKESFGNEHIAHSKNISVSALENLVSDQSTTTIIVAPESDKAIFETAKNILAKKPFPYFFLRGGIDAWKKINAPLISQADTQSFVDQSKVTFIELTEFRDMQKNNVPFFLLDIQTKEDYLKKHIQGATNIPFAQIEERASEIPLAKLIIVYGGNSTLSFYGGTLLFDLGIFSAKVLHGNDYLSSSSGILLEP